MLEQVLAIIEKSGTISPVALAARLGVSPQMVDLMLEDLERRGYLHSISQDAACAGAACSGCPVADTGCGSKPRIWQLDQRLSE